MTEYQEIINAKKEIINAYETLVKPAKYGISLNTEEMAAKIKEIPNGIKAFASMVHESAWDGRLCRKVTQWAANQSPYIPDMEKHEYIGHDPIHLAVLDSIALAVIRQTE